MEELVIYTHQKDIPPLIYQQILDFLRIVWPDGFKGDNRLRAWITNEDIHPITFVIMEKNQVISALQVVWKYLKHDGETYKTYGLTTVMTYPQFRNQGYGLKLLETTKKYIEEQDADIVMFNSGTKGFYEKAGYELMDTLTLLKGDANNPEKEVDHTFMLFLSDKGKKGRASFETKPIYFGEDTW